MTAVTINVDDDFKGKEYITRFAEDGTVYKTYLNDNIERRTVVDMVVKKIVPGFDVYNTLPNNKPLSLKPFRKLDYLLPLLEIPWVIDDCIDLFNETEKDEKDRAGCIFVLLGLLLLSEKRWELKLSSIRIIQQNMCHIGLARLCVYATLKGRIDFDTMFTEKGALIETVARNQTLLYSDRLERYRFSLANLSILYESCSFKAGGAYLYTTGNFEIGRGVYVYIYGRFMADMVKKNLDKVSMNHQDFGVAMAFMLSHQYNESVEMTRSLIHCVITRFEKQLSAIKNTSTDKYIFDREERLYRLILAFLTNRVMAYREGNEVRSLVLQKFPSIATIINDRRFLQFQLLYSHYKPLELYYTPSSQIRPLVGDVE